MFGKKGCRSRQEQNWYSNPITKGSFIFEALIKRVFNAPAIRGTEV